MESILAALPFVFFAIFSVWIIVDIGKVRHHFCDLQEADVFLLLALTVINVTAKTFLFVMVCIIALKVVMP